MSDNFKKHHSVAIGIQIVHSLSQINCSSDEKNVQIFCVTVKCYGLKAHLGAREVLMRSCCGCGVRQFACSLSRVLRKFNKVQSGGGGAHTRARAHIKNANADN